MNRGIPILILIILFAVGNAIAQTPLTVVTPKTVSVSDKNNTTSYFADRNEPARAIEFKYGTVTASSFLTNINTHFNIPAEFSFIETESSTDDLGIHHRFVQQYYKGIRIDGLGYRIHEKDGFVKAANGKAVRDIKLNMEASLGEEQAFQIAKQIVNTKDTTIRRGEKIIVSKGFTFKPESFFVAYQFDIDVSLIERWRISIDARSGQMLNKVSLVNTCETGERPLPVLPNDIGTGLTNYYGMKNIKVQKFPGSSGSTMVGETDHGVTIGTYDFGNVSVISILLFFEFSHAYSINSSDNTYNDPYLKPAVSAQWAAEQALEYYFKKHNRLSFDNNGAAVTSYVHVDVNLNNAFWTGKILAFGDGNNNNPLVELDVVSHELTHAVTQYEAKLQYYNEPGALNESFSDILGKAVEFDNFGDSATWQIARHNTVGGLRDMSNPNLKNQPDTYGGDMWYTGYEDYGGVHYNSGVQNFWYYLLCKGGSGVNDQQKAYAVNAIGMDAATQIAYRNLTEYLSPASDYLDSRIGSMLAAADLYGKNSAIYQEVDKAWDAVGVIDEPIITSLQVYDITGTTVKIKGSLLPRGTIVSYHFEYGTTPVLGSTSSEYTYTNTVEGSLTGLQSQTKYYLRLVATNENGKSSFDSDFKTISLAPLVKIKQTVDVTETTAVFYGEVNPNSLTTTYYFEYGTTPALGLVTTTTSLSNATEFLKVSANVSGLQRRQTYYYRLTATNSFATTKSAAVTFFTGSIPAINSFTPNTAPVGAVVTIAGQNFNPVKEKNLVSFGAARGTVLSSSASEIKVEVPQGASFGSISLQDAESGLAGESIREFVPTFTGEFKTNGSFMLTMAVNDIGIYQTIVQDMDGDNKPDIFTAHYPGFSVFQNVNQGGDIDEKSFIRSTFNTDQNLGMLALADLDGNGLKDVVGTYQGRIRVYPNFSVPGYVFFGTPVDVKAVDYLDNMIFADFDRDGHVDIAGLNGIQGVGRQFIILRNQNPKGSLSGDNFERHDVSVIPSDVSFLNTGDINKDGAIDAMVSVYGQNNFLVLINNSQPGSFSFDQISKPDVTRGRFARYITNDLNGDGSKDVIGHSPYESGNLSIFQNKSTSSNISLASPSIVMKDTEATGIQAGDMNGDGYVDLMMSNERRQFFFLKNKEADGGQLSTSSFEKFGQYGMSLPDNIGSGSVSTQISLNDLNGDGKPEVINANSYSYGPHDGYSMEIWQNSPSGCADPSLVSVKIANNIATIVLPSNATMDQYEIDYSQNDYDYWYNVTSPTFSFYSAYSYRIRVRSKCYLGFSEYYYIDITADCVYVADFAVNVIDANSVSIQAYNLSSIAVQYSLAGIEQWQDVPENASQIADLLPGTTYDIRYRGRWCYKPAEYNYKQFTTPCPKLSVLTITDIAYNSAKVSLGSFSSRNAIIEYSPDNINWSLVDETLTMFPLTPATDYFVRARMKCANVNSDFISRSFTTPCPKVSAVTVNNVTPFSAGINWTDDEINQSYVLTYTVAGTSTTTTLNTSAKSFMLTGLNPGTQYTVAVAPQCAKAALFTSVVFNTVCYLPSDLSVDNITYTTAELSWSDVYSGPAYFIDYSITSGNYWRTTQTTSTNVMLEKLRPGVEYEVRVHINCPSEKAPYISLRFKTKIYDETTYGPNPTDSKIVLHPSKDLIGNSFLIHDSTGKIMRSGKLQDYTIDLSDFSPGIYVLKIDGEQVIKVVKY